MGLFEEAFLPDLEKNCSEDFSTGVCEPSSKRRRLNSVDWPLANYQEKDASENVEVDEKELLLVLDEYPV